MRCTHWTGGSWYCWHKNATILFIWRHCQHSQSHGIDWWRWVFQWLWYSHWLNLKWHLFFSLTFDLIALKIHITAEMNDELAIIGGFKTEHRGLIDVKVSFWEREKTHVCVNYRWVIILWTKKPIKCNKYHFASECRSFLLSMHAMWLMIHIKMYINFVYLSSTF